LQRVIASIEETGNPDEPALVDGEGEEPSGGKPLTQAFCRSAA
jgi:hypothetical protein